MNLAKEKRLHSDRDSISDMLSIISHNVRGPIQYMKHVTEFALKNWDTLNPEDLKAWATSINESSQDMNQMLTNMLYWAEMQKNSIVPIQSTFMLFEVIDDEVKLHRTALQFKSIQIENWIPKEFLVTMDANLLRLVFQNVLSNAIKFSLPGSRIWIEAKLHETEFELILQDEGKGMSPEDLEKLENDDFLSSLGTHEERGSGLGTALTRKLITLLKGRITMESQLDAGTKVFLHFPL
jgi:signal transduction histidine kinase